MVSKESFLGIEEATPHPTGQSQRAAWAVQSSKVGGATSWTIASCSWAEVKNADMKTDAVNVKDCRWGILDKKFSPVIVTCGASVLQGYRGTKAVLGGL